MSEYPKTVVIGGVECTIDKHSDVQAGYTTFRIKKGSYRDIDAIAMVLRVPPERPDDLCEAEIVHNLRKQMAGLSDWAVKCREEIASAMQGKGSK